MDHPGRLVAHHPPGRDRVPARWESVPQIVVVVIFTMASVCPHLGRATSSGGRRAPRRTPPPAPRFIASSVDHSSGPHSSTIRLRRCKGHLTRTESPARHRPGRGMRPAPGRVPRCQTKMAPSDGRACWRPRRRRRRRHARGLAPRTAPRRPGRPACWPRRTRGRPPAAVAETRCWAPRSPRCRSSSRSARTRRRASCSIASTADRGRGGRQPGRDFPAHRSRRLTSWSAAPTARSGERACRAPARSGTGQALVAAVAVPVFVASELQGSCCRLPHGRRLSPSDEAALERLAVLPAAPGRGRSTTPRRSRCASGGASPGAPRHARHSSCSAAAARLESVHRPGRRGGPWHARAGAAGGPASGALRHALRASTALPARAAPVVSLTEAVEASAPASPSSSCSASWAPPGWRRSSCCAWLAGAEQRGRHSRAWEVVIALSFEPEAISIAVQDDGVGPCATGARRPGSASRARGGECRALGGELALSGNEDGGAKPGPRCPGRETAALRAGRRRPPHRALGTSLLGGSRFFELVGEATTGAETLLRCEQLHRTSCCSTCAAGPPGATICTRVKERPGDGHRDPDAYEEEMVIRGCRKAASGACSRTSASRTWSPRCRWPTAGLIDLRVAGAMLPRDRRTNAVTDPSEREEDVLRELAGLHHARDRHAPARVAEHGRTHLRGLFRQAEPRNRVQAPGLPASATDLGRLPRLIGARPHRALAPRRTPLGPPTVNMREPGAVRRCVLRARRERRCARRPTRDRRREPVAPAGHRPASPRLRRDRGGREERGSGVR